MNADAPVDSFLRAIAATDDAVPPLVTGNVIGGHYRIDGWLGRGGMGVVHRATDLVLGRAVAIKVLHAPIAPADLLREARLAASLTHPNIATVFEAGVDDDRVFVAMELVEGRTLRAVLAQGPLRKDDALSIARALADALEHAHAQGVVHRDLKPENVIVGPRGPKVLDFGLAKAVTTAGPPPLRGDTDVTRRGTVGYMAPEQVRGDRVDGRSDVFALGVVVREMLDGMRPFAGASTAEVFDATMAGSISRSPRMPSFVDALTRRCLSRDPQDRPTMADVKRALASPPAPGRRWLALGAAISAALAIVWLAQRPSPHRAAEATIPATASQRTAMTNASATAALVTVVTVATVASIAPDDPVVDPKQAKPIAKPIASQKTTATAPVVAPVHSISAIPSVSPPVRLPKGAPCARSSECAAGWCVAERCL